MDRRRRPNVCTMNMVVERLGLATLLLVVAVPKLLVQTCDAQFHTAANIVLINATILDRDSRPVRGLGHDSYHSRRRFLPVRICYRDYAAGRWSFPGAERAATACSRRSDRQRTALPIRF